MSTICMIADLGFGDSGKGSTTDLLVRNLNSELVVRYNGGPQAGHTVVLPDGTRHIFAQFGAGTFAGALTFLSKYMLINPLNMALEAEKLSTFGIDPFRLMIVSPKSLVVTPLHVYANRAREEARGAFKHGSCGMGIGETVKYDIDNPIQSLRVEDLKDVRTTTDKLVLLQQRLSNELRDLLTASGMYKSKHLEALSNMSTPKLVEAYSEWVANIVVMDDEEVLAKFLKKGNIVFEGAQGVLLDEKYGFKPHNTWTNTTFENADNLIAPLVEGHDVSKIGVLRTYTTRHGAGPLPTETKEFDCVPLDKTNVNNQWQDSFRRGYLDLKLMKYALDCIGHVDELVLSHVDDTNRMPEYKVCTDYNIQGNLNDSLLKWVQPQLSTVEKINIRTYISDYLNVPIRITSHGPTFKDKQIASKE